MPSYKDSFVASSNVKHVCDHDGVRYVARNDALGIYILQNGELKDVDKLPGPVLERAQFELGFYEMISDARE